MGASQAAVSTKDEYDPKEAEALWKQLRRVSEFHFTLEFKENCERRASAATSDVEKIRLDESNSKGFLHEERCQQLFQSSAVGTEPDRASAEDQPSRSSSQAELGQHSRSQSRAGGVGLEESSSSLHDEICQRSLFQDSAGGTRPEKAAAEEQPSSSLMRGELCLHSSVQMSAGGIETRLEKAATARRPVSAGSENLLRSGQPCDDVGQHEARPD